MASNWTSEDKIRAFGVNVGSATYGNPRIEVEDKTLAEGGGRQDKLEHRSSTHWRNNANKH